MERIPENIADDIKKLVKELKGLGRNDLLLQAIGLSTLEELRIEAAKANLSRLLITKDYRFILVDYNNIEINLFPIHKAVYLLFLAHPEGIEFKHLIEFRDELLYYYQQIAKSIDRQKTIESIDRLIDPFDNSINEKCSYIKNCFLKLMDEYSAYYYIISSHTQRHIAGSSRIWYKRLKIITLPRHFVIQEH